MATQLDPNFLYLTIKIGDKRTALVKPDHIGMKHGMIVEVIDPREWRQRVYHSDHMQRVFGLMKVERSWKQSLIQTTSSIDTPGAERERAGYIDLPELETLTGIINLESDWKSSSVVTIVDGTMLSPSIIKDSSLKTFDKVIDWNAVSAGSYTVGTGQDYTTWVDAFADIANLTANLTFTQAADSTDTALATITEDLGGFTFKMTSNQAHLGDPTASVHIASFNQNAIMFRFEAEGPGVMDVGTLYCRRITTAAANSVFAIFQVTTEFTLKFHDILADQNSLGGRFLRILDADVICHVWNLKIWDADNGNPFIIDASGGNSSNLYENITILNSDLAAFQFNSNPGTMRNCYGEDPTEAGQDAFVLHSGMTGRNNASSDDTADDANWSVGSGNLTSIATTEFESTSDSSSDFANVIDGALSTAGSATEITENIVGMRGNEGGRTGSTPSIGGDEFPAVVAAAGTSLAIEIKV